MRSGADIRVTYRLSGEAAEADALAHAIAYEQTVELPAAQIDGTPAAANVGRIEAIVPDPDVPGTQRACIAYPAALASAQLGQLFNLLYGNISMYRGVRLLELALPDALLMQFEGPRFGAAGLRRLTGVYGRPLLATAVKPRGATPAELASIVEAFARGGGDIVKDDQNLVHAGFDEFRDHVDACAGAVERANAASGRQCLYLPHLAGPDEELARRAEFVRRRGLRGVLMCPLVLGLDRTRALAEACQLLFMAHPALTGAYTRGTREGIAPAILLGTLFRLAGADVSVFPTPGGRFEVTSAACTAIAEALAAPLGNLVASLPAPAGGIQVSQVPKLAAGYGTEAVWLIGGALRGDTRGITAATRALLSAMNAYFEPRQEPPETMPVSACELPGTGVTGPVQSLLRVGVDFHWSAREDQCYKSTQALPFRGVRRVELIGKQGEPCHFELRYFELEPGGYTSHEKHLHTHVLIGARGHGTVLMGEERIALHPDDIAYIAPWRVHQLRNESDRPFGFYCIVDRERDRPLAP